MVKKVYISGFGVPLTRAQINNFRRAQEYLEAYGYEVMNPVRDDEYKDIRENIAILLKCNAIYMLNGWKRIYYSTVEWRIAIELGIDVMYESRYEEDDILKDLEDAVSIVTGYNLGDLAAKSRNQEIANARHLFIYTADRVTQLSSNKIARLLMRDHSTIIHSIKVAESLLKTDPAFNKLYNSITNIIYDKQKEYKKICCMQAAET